MGSKTTALNLQKIASQLEDWFDPKQRELPWRESKDPYKVWISEIMLQQTTTQVVRGYFKRFIESWPTVESLADAQLEDIYVHWQGLGYYSRARNIHKTSKIITDELGGNFPSTAAELIKLPGIGPYTSRAISSICSGEKVGVVDGNVLRVFNRLLGRKVNWWEGVFHKKTQIFSDDLANLGSSASLMNQALMDLGSTVCTPKKPSCLLCPVKTLCSSKKKKVQHELPLPKPKKKPELWSYTVYTNSLKHKNLLILKELPDSPILKKSPLPYGTFKKLDEKPSKYSFIHTITKHKIYVSFKKKPARSRLKPEKITLNGLVKLTPSSLIEKIWQSPDFHEKM